jgi:hypothetical protein
MKNFFKFILFYMIGKPIKVSLFDKIAGYYISEITVSKSWKDWNDVDVIGITLRTKKY